MILFAAHRAGAEPLFRASRQILTVDPRSGFLETDRNR